MEVVARLALFAFKGREAMRFVSLLTLSRTHEPGAIISLKGGQEAMRFVSLLTLSPSVAVFGGVQRGDPREKRRPEARVAVLVSGPGFCLHA
jgi:hypothetical protein